MSPRQTTQNTTGNSGAASRQASESGFMVMGGEDVVGKPLDRIDGRQKVTGTARYAAEFDLPGLVYAVSVQSTIANGRIVQIDTRQADALPGVLAVITHLNAPKLHAPEQNTGKSKPENAQQTIGRPGQKLLPLQGDRIYYSGQHIGVVVATTFEQAMFAAERITVYYEAEKPVTEMERHLDQAFRGPQDPGREPNDSLRGDPDHALEVADVRVEQVYRTPVENHNPMEPSATVAVWNGDQLTLYDATQWVSGSQHVVAIALGIPPENVRTISYFLGGGFGCKGFTWPHTILAAVAAKRVGRPVQFALTRKQMFTSVGYRAETSQHIKLGATHDGQLLSMSHETFNQTSPYDEFVEKAGVLTPMLYACPNVRAVHKLVRINKGTPTSMRAPGEAPGSFALESAMDELAYALKMDPIALRIRNYADRDPHRNVPWSSKSLRTCYEVGANKFGWERREPAPRSMREGDLLIGWGMATASYPTNRSQATARVEIFPDGRARAISGTQDIGTGTYTIMTQILADNLGIPVQNAHFELGDSTMPQAPVSGGSQTAASVGSAVKVAALEARRKAMQMAMGDSASPLYGQSEDQIVASDGRLYLRSDARRGESYADLLRRQKQASLVAEGSAKPGPEKQQYSSHAFGAQFAEVVVHPESGETRVRRFLGAYAAGRILNAKTGQSQVMGGMVFGIGMALMEQTVLDTRSGRIVNADLAEYHMPVNADVPTLEAYFVAEEDPYVNPIGAKGIGELGIVGAAAAIANAVYHATGKRIRDLPITPDKLLS